MALQRYGVLIGTVKGLVLGTARDSSDRLRVATKDQEWAVRISTAFQPPALGEGPEADPEGLAVESALLNPASAWVRELAAWCKKRSGFFEASSTVPNLDYVRDQGLVDPKGFTDGTAAQHALADLVAEADACPDSWVAIFGVRGSAHGLDLDHIHMNQGGTYVVGRHLRSRIQENGVHQDGGIVFFLGDKVRGYFAKFHGQTLSTNAYGHPLSTGVPGLDKVLATLTPKQRADLRLHSARKAPSPTSRLRTQPFPATPTTTAFAAGQRVFDDPSPLPDPQRPFQADEDDGSYKSPYVQQFDEHGVPEPVPAPRDGQTQMALADVLGTASVKAIQAGGRIVMHFAGDTGAPTGTKLPHEMTVAKALVQDAARAEAGSKPAFYYILGDVVYYYGEEAYYYDQFYKPYKDYPGPIFAVPGNHDGLTYDSSMVSLQAFLAAFCDSRPSHWSGAGGIARTTMTQPGPYFTLNAPFVSVIGLYSNCSERLGYLDDTQKLFLLSELKRLKALKKNGLPAVIVAVHHPPFSVAPSKPGSMDLGAAMDAACKQADFWPDAVLSGHAHLYQRFARTLPQGRQLLYVVSGAGGYDLDGGQEVDKPEFKLLDQSDPEFKLHRVCLDYGFTRVTVETEGGASLRIEYLSPDSGAVPVDACVLDLKTNTLLS